LMRATSVVMNEGAQKCFPTGIISAPLLQIHPAGHSEADFLNGQESQRPALFPLYSSVGWQNSSVKRAGGAGGHAY
jgi:hypothetical protein